MLNERRLRLNDPLQDDVGGQQDGLGVGHGARGGCLRKIHRVAVAGVDDGHGEEDRTEPSRFDVHIRKMGKDDRKVRTSKDYNRFIRIRPVV